MASRAKVKKTVENIIGAGNDPLAAKKALEHGRSLKRLSGWGAGKTRKR